MQGDMPQVNLVALVGAGGTIGPLDGLPKLIDKGEAANFEEWFLQLTHGGTIVVGYRTMEMLQQIGFSGFNGDWIVVCWNRDGLYDPDQFITELKSVGRPIFICGGRSTFETFMPYVQQFFIRRAALSQPHEVFMPALFGRTQ